MFVLTSQLLFFRQSPQFFKSFEMVKTLNLTFIPFTLLAAAFLTGCQSLPTQPKTVSHIEIHPSSEDASTSTFKSAAVNIHQTALDESIQNAVESTPKPKASLADLSIWQALSNHFQLTDKHKEQYQSYLQYYLRHKSYLTRISKRAKPYLYHIFQEVKKRNMPYEIVLLPAVESGFSPKAKSYQSAAGLWQFIPGTAHLYDLDKNWWYDGRMDILHSTQAALDYLQKLYELNDQDWLLALASYNAGYGNVLKAQKKFHRYHPKQKADFWAIRKYLPQETQNYVPQLLAMTYLIKHRDQYQIVLEDIPNKPFIEAIPLKQQVSLEKVRKITGVSKKLMKQLNPCYLRPTTPPNGKHHLVLPKACAEIFKEKMAKDKSLFKIQWARHKVRPGESLSTIAHQYHTSIREIKRINHLHSNLIRAGKILLIPYPQQYAKQLPQKLQQKYNGAKYYHTVKRGESLWSIANYYNISTRTLCRWNNIGIRTPLRVGQKIEIRSANYGKKIVHKLKKGESLWLVAHRYGTTTTQLAKWNHIKRSQLLQPGEELIVWLPKQSQQASKKPALKKRDEARAQIKTKHDDQV